MKFLRNLSTVLFTLLIFVAGQNAFAQWKKIFNTTGGIECIYFKEFNDRPIEGFVSGRKGLLYQTLDGGLTWNQLTMPSQYSQSTAGCFAFKDSLNGWFCESFVGYKHLFKTIDGGVNWNKCVTTLSAAGSIVYLRSSNLLFGSTGSGGNGSYIFSIDGDNFSFGKKLPGLPYGGVSITFSDDLHGILSSAVASNNNIAYTTDGGSTWKTIGNNRKLIYA